MYKILASFRYRSDLTQSHIYHQLAIVLCIVIAFWRLPSLSFLIGWDDQWFVLNSYTQGGINWKNVSAICTDFYYGQYAPVNQLYYTLVHLCFGYKPLYYHLGSIIIHAVNAILVYKFVYQIAGQLSGSYERNTSQIAFLATVLFSISPFNLEPVAWVAASKVLLYALFYLLAMLTYIKYISTKKSRYFYLTMVSFVVAFGAKEQAVTFPAAILLIDYVYSRNFKSDVLWYEKLPFVILSLLFGLATLQSQGASGDSGAQFYPYYQRIILAFYTVAEYFIKSILPINVSYLYPFPFQIGEPVPLWLWFYSSAFPLLGICFFSSLGRRKWLIFGSLFFLVHIFLVSNIFSLARFSIVADRYNYISSIGVYFLVAFVIVTLLRERVLPKALVTCCVIYVCGFLFYTNLHSQVWASAITLKEKMRTTVGDREDFKTWEYNRTKTKGHGN